MDLRAMHSYKLLQKMIALIQRSVHVNVDYDKL